MRTYQGGTLERQEQGKCIDIVNKKLYNEYDKTGYNKSGRSCYYGEYKYQYPYGCGFEAAV